MIVFLQSVENKRRYLMRIIMLAAIVVFAVISFLLDAPPDELNAVAEATTNSEDTIEEELDKNIDKQLDKLDFSELEKYLTDIKDAKLFEVNGGSVKQIVKQLILNDDISFEGLFKVLFSSGSDNLLDCASVFALICAISITCGLLKNLQGEANSEGIGKIVYFVGYASIALVIINSLIKLIGGCYSAVENLQTQMEIAFPILLTLIATSGGSASVAIYQPSTAFVSLSITKIITETVFPLTVIMLVFRLLSSLSSEIRLNKLCELIKTVNRWIIGIMLTVFSFYLGIKGLGASAADTVTIKTIKYAISNGIPIAGNFLSGGFDVLIACCTVIKNAFGIFVVILLASSVFKPVVTLLAYALCLKLTAAVCEISGDKETAALTYDLSKGINFLISGVLCVAFAYFICVFLIIISANNFT